ncbi:hypothetical protein MIR68_011603 [Amoeboaphelidium protococcarum]|nr:hypothetical protein MIR68_011603 [Amoeboaphelidium protococcarum]KAI3652389.1 hypothetical protein MP228_002714 [Amoeboaphelidium protococcarum]
MTRSYNPDSPVPREDKAASTTPHSPDRIWVRYGKEARSTSFTRRMFENDSLVDDLITRVKERIPTLHDVGSGDIALLDRKGSEIPAEQSLEKLPATTQRHPLIVFDRKSFREGFIIPTEPSELWNSIKRWTTVAIVFILLFLISSFFVSKDIQEFKRSAKQAFVVFQQGWRIGSWTLSKVIRILMPKDRMDD